MKHSDKGDDKRTEISKLSLTNEKPVSLFPLPFEEVVRDLLATKPMPKEKSQKHKKSSKTS